MEINAYSRVNNSSSINSTNNLNVQTESTTLGMNDFLKLIVAQMSNQDAMNPVDNTEYISQMAQFSSLQAMTDLAKVAEQGQATALIGKNVVMAKYNDLGELEIEEGIVGKVTIHSGETNLYVNDKLYNMSNVMEIKSDSLNPVELLNNTVTEETTI